jgi:hypothetical protein
LHHLNAVKDVGSKPFVHARQAMHGIAESGRTVRL